MNISIGLSPKFENTLNQIKYKYKPEMEELNVMSNDNLNFTSFIDGFVEETTNMADVSSDANSNSSQKNATSLIKEMTKPFTKLLSFNKIYYELDKKYGNTEARKWLESEYNGELYMHDAYTSSIFPYCYNFDLQPIAEKGLFFLGEANTKAPQHWDTFNSHVFEFLVYASNSQSGAVGLASYLIEAFYFYKKDIKEKGISEDRIASFRSQHFQSFIYNLNQAFVRTSEPAFTNLTIFDRNYLYELFGGRAYLDGSLVIDHVEEIMEFQKDFMREVAKTRKHYMFTFPVLTYSMLKDEKTGRFVDEEFFEWMVEHNLIWYDSNIFSSSDITTLASCCRLQSDMTKLRGYMNSTGGSGLSIGSVKVNTINLMRVALLSIYSKRDFWKELERITDIAIKSLDVQRSIIKRNIEKGLLPMYTHGLMKLENQYSTIGLNGAYNMLELLGYIETDEFGYETLSKEGEVFLNKVLDFINKRKDENDFDYSFNIEFIPAERASVINCKKDKVLFPEAPITVDLYANQYIDLRSNATLEERMRLAGIFDKKCGGGNILHINIEGALTVEKAEEIMFLANKYGVTYYALTGKISCCDEKHEYTLETKCPVCNKPVTETFQRIVGYYTPVKNWSKERREEATLRKWYKSDNILEKKQRKRKGKE